VRPVAKGGLDRAKFLAHRFGQNLVPPIHGWDDSSGNRSRPLSWLLQLARGRAASLMGSASAIQTALNRSLQQHRAVPVRVPLRRMNEALKRANCLGQVTAIQVS
jgi:hypothetical protein